MSQSDAVAILTHGDEEGFVPPRDLSFRVWGHRGYRRGTIQPGSRNEVRTQSASEKRPTLMWMGYEWRIGSRQLFRRLRMPK